MLSEQANYLREFFSIQSSTWYEEFEIRTKAGNVLDQSKQYVSVKSSLMSFIHNQYTVISADAQVYNQLNKSQLDYLPNGVVKYLVWNRI